MVVSDRADSVLNSLSSTKSINIPSARGYDTSHILATVDVSWPNGVFYQSKITNSGTTQLNAYIHQALSVSSGNRTKDGGSNKGSRQPGFPIFSHRAQKYKTLVWLVIGLVECNFTCHSAEVNRSAPGEWI